MASEKHSTGGMNVCWCVVCRRDVRALAERLAKEPMHRSVGELITMMANRIDDQHAALARPEPAGDVLQTIKEKRREEPDKP